MSNRPEAAAAAARREVYFALSRGGDVEAFSSWMQAASDPLRRALRRYCREVDLEVVIQETFLRLWKRLLDEPGFEIEGESASLRYAVGIARNVVREEARRLRRLELLDDETLASRPETWVEPAPVADPGLAAAIRRCRDRLPARPRQALDARLDGGGAVPDRELAASVGMKPNTFLQNIVRARKLLRQCLEAAGIRLQEILA